MHGVGVAVGVGDAVGVAVGVGGGPDCAQYLPPLLKKMPTFSPPQTIISLPVQTAVWEFRAAGASEMLVALQTFVLGLYRPPVFK